MSHTVSRPTTRPLVAALLAAMLAVGCASNAPSSGQGEAGNAGAATTGQSAGGNSASGDANTQDAQASRTAQVPGFYRMKLGELTVTVLYDGYVEIDAKLLKGASVAAIAQLLRNGLQPSKGGVQTSVNAFLLDDGKNMVLVDTGSADTMGESAGHLWEALSAAG